MGGCMGQWVGSGQMTNLIKLELINIIWFCLKIYNLLRHPYLWVDGWAHVKPLKSNKSRPNRDNSIMDILDILLDILLKPPQPLMGLFFKPCFDTQPKAFPSEINYSPAAPHCPSPWPFTAQQLCLCLCFHLFFYNNYLLTMQYNWLESETQCSLMHSVLNSLRDRLWFNRLKDTETWSRNVMLRITYLSHSLSSLITTLLTSSPSPLLPTPLPSHL